MLTTPDDTPVTTPAEVTVARAVLLLSQKPPGVASARVITLPTPTELLPVIAAGTGLTVSTRDTEQPVDKV
jgi:hypothetical protein